MSITDSELDVLLGLITPHTGIIPRETHKAGIRNFVERTLEKDGIPFQTYMKRISADEAKFGELVNESTVNETYFFREERQFAFLRDRIFREWVSRNGPRPIRIWSAACSYGEEPYSIALLSIASGVNAQIAASDINTNALEHCQRGKFRGNALRRGDGEPFHPLVERYSADDGFFQFPPEVRSRIRVQQINLADLESCRALVPKMQNVIFIRNVFIYFSRELRGKILKFLAENCLDAGGYLFVSMSEVAQIDPEITPPGLEKVSEGSVFCFRKRNGG